jgi:4-amino-4-deoxy-L-arabinose transferase-like glycosyltransferase
VTTLNRKASTTNVLKPTRPSRQSVDSRLKGKGWLIALAAILVLAAALRIAWIVYADAKPGEPVLDDVAFYDFVAQSLAKGTGYVHFYLQGEDPPATAQWPPGYPFVLAGMYKAFGHNIYFPKALNVIAGMATCLLIYAIGSRLFDRRTALLGALIFALFPSAIHYSTLLSTESTFPVLLYAMVFLLFLWGARDAPFSPLKLLALGILFGAAALYRSEAGLLFVAVVLAWLLTQSNWRPVTQGGADGWRLW